MTLSPTPSNSSSTQQSILSIAGRSAGTQAIVLVTSAVLGIVTTRLVIETYGPSAYVQYALLVGLTALIPFSDLGLSAAVMNAVGGSSDPARDEHVRRVLTTNVRVLTASAGVMLIVALVLGALDVWPTILGAALDPSTGSLAATACLALLAIGLPLGLGQRLLTATGRNHVQIAISGLRSPLVLASLGLIIWLGLLDPGLLAVVPYAVLAVVGAGMTVLAARLLRPVVWQAFRDARRLRSRPGARVFDMAWPMLIQMAIQPILYQSGRIVLSHVSTEDQVAQYSLAAQIFAPMWAMVGAAGITLWPMFAAARQSDRSVSPLPMTGVFASVGALVLIAVALVSPWLASLASGGRIVLDPLLIVSFTVFIWFQAVKFPTGMFMTDPAGMRFQAYMTLALVPVGLTMSIWLAGLLGAAGPVIASAVAVLVFQVLANFAYVRRASMVTRQGRQEAQ